MNAAGGALSLVVPVFNEHARIEPALIPLIEFVTARGPGSELIFVDDGSTDATGAIIEKIVGSRPQGDCAVRVLSRGHRGKGAAIQAGIGEARCDLVAFCDVDLATPLEELARIVDVATTGVLAIGSRGLPTSSLGVREHRTRETLGRAFNRLVQLSLAPGITDTQCGAKAAPLAMWQTVLPSVEEPGLAWDVEVIAQWLARDLPIAEVPIVWNHQPGSAVNVTREGIAMLRALPRIRARVVAARTKWSQRPVDRAIDAVFDDDNAKTLADADYRHWWFRSRAAYVNWALGRYACGPGWLMDLGAGAGGVTARFAWDRTRTLAVEGNRALATYAHRTHRIHVVLADAATLPFRPGGAAATTLLDVIEHVPEPLALLRAANAALAADGICIVTVPGHAGLWSKADESLGHYRRYNRASLRAEMEAAGLRVEYVGHIFSWLFLPVWFRRNVKSTETAELGLDVDSTAVSAAALVLTACERSLLRFVSLPFGTSVLAIAHRGPNPVRAP